VPPVATHEIEYFTRRQHSCCHGPLARVLALELPVFEAHLLQNVSVNVALLPSFVTYPSYYPVHRVGDQL